jgi:hypothetical protein
VPGIHSRDRSSELTDTECLELQLIENLATGLYIKAFDPAVLAAMNSLEATLGDFHKCSATVQQVN